MSEVNVDQLQNNVKVLQCRLDAVQQTLNEAMQTSINLRTNLLLLNQNNQELNAHLNSHKQQVTVLTNKVAELQQPKADEEVKSA